MVKSIGNWHNSLKIQRKLCEIHIDHSVKSRYFETEQNMSLELYPWSSELFVCVQVYRLIKKDVPQAWHEPATTYINMSLLL
jgi:hypothetical protein